MKKLTFLSALLFAAAQGVAAQTITTETPSAIFSEDSDVSVARGMSREAVSFKLGLPSETLGTDVWFFYNFRGRGAAAAENLDTLLVVFVDDRVTTLRVCDSRPVRELIAKQKVKRAPKTASAKWRSGAVQRAEWRQCYDGPGHRAWVPDWPKSRRHDGRRSFRTGACAPCRPAGGVVGGGVCGR